MVSPHGVREIGREPRFGSSGHAGASHVTVALGERHGGIELEVADDGVGFDPEAAIRGTAVGLVAIRERVRHAGGTWALDSRPGAGTRILVRVPL